MHDNQSTTIGELIARGILEVSDGYRTRQDQLAASGLPILRAADVLDGSLSPSFKDHVAFEYRPKMGAKTSRAGDVLVTTKGTVGRVAQVPDEFPQHVYSPQVCFLRSLNPDELAPRWLYGWARSLEFASQAGTHKDQTDMAPYISLRDLRRFRITLPQPDEQRRVAGVLGMLDDLIDINRRLGRALDSRLVASWLALARQCGTECVLGELADLRKGVSYKGVFLAENGLPLINLGNFALDGSFKESGTKYYLGPVKDGQRLSKGSLVVANTDLTQRCEILARPLLVPYEAATSTHHTFQVKVRGSTALRAWVFYALRTEAIRRRLISFATGTTVAALPADALLSQGIPLASDQIIDRWWSRASALREAQESVGAEAVELVRTRDALLPLLLSGRIRVEDVTA